MARIKILLITSILLFILVLLGVYTMTILAQNQDPTWLEYFAPLIILTGFFIFLISAGLFIYAIIKLIQSQK